MVDIRETVQKVIQELVLPDLAEIRQVRVMLEAMNERLDDALRRIADQNHRLDMRIAWSKRIDGLSRRLDKTNQRIDSLQIDYMARFDKLHSELARHHDRLHGRLDDLARTMIARAEHEMVLHRVGVLERTVEDLRSELAA